jgi:hypothetical protein
VQRLYMILSPRGRDSYRLLIAGSKRRPAVEGRGDRKAWAFVEKVASRAERSNHTHLAYALKLPPEPGEVQEAQASTRHGEPTCPGRSRTCSEGGASFPARQQETEATAEIFSDLGMEKELHPTAPLFEGKCA